MLLDLQQSEAAARLHPNWKAEDHLIAVLARNAREQPDEVALRERDHGIWQEYSWADYLDSVLAFAAGLEAQGEAFRLLLRHGWRQVDETNHEARIAEPAHFVVQAGP